MSKVPEAAASVKNASIATPGAGLTPNKMSLPDGWAFGSVDLLSTSITTSNKKIKTKDAKPTGRFPVVDQGANPVSGFVDDEALVIDASEHAPVILFGDHTKIIKFITYPFVPGADGTKLLRPVNGWHPRFALYCLQNVKLPDRGYGRHFQFLRDAAIPVAPEQEQQRIAVKLDAVLARAGACRDRLAQVAPLLKRFRQSVLAAATSGRLTQDWRNSHGIGGQEPSLALESIPLPPGYKRLSKQSFRSVPIEYRAVNLPSGWSIRTVEELYEANVIIDFADGNHGSLYPRKEEFGEEGALFLTATQMGEEWQLDIGSCPRLRREKAAQLTKGWAINGDVLLSHNATVGRVALLEGVHEPVLLGTSVTFYRFNSDWFNPRFARVVFSSPFFQDQLSSVMAQTTRDQVPITKQISLNMIYAPIIEQREIARRVETLFAYAGRIAARLAAAQVAADRLTPALLAKAFRGELVPQDPNDEPASELLKRLSAATGESAKKSSHRR